MRVLAGGQTLLATLNMRLSQPALLVDIGGLDRSWRGIAAGQGDVLRIGALTRHVEIEESPLVAQHAPLLAQAAPHIAHRAIRNLGTIGGTLAYADPAAEWPACVLALGGTLVLQSAAGRPSARVAAADFFQGLYTTARARRRTAGGLSNCPWRRTRRAPPLQTNWRAAMATTPSPASRRLRETHGRPRDSSADVRLCFLSLGDRPLRAPAPPRPCCRPGR